MTITQSRRLPLLDDAAPSSCPEISERDAGFGAMETVRGRLPLSALDINGRIDGLLSQVTVRQTFVNPTGEPLEATYIFPLPDRAGVTDFRMEVGGRLVEGLLKERGQARRDYTQAMRQGHRASIAEEERPGVFSLRVGNLMPGDVATVQLTVVGVLPYRDGEVTFRFPLVVAPRYIPGVPLSGRSVGDGTAVDTSAVPDASRISPPVLLRGFPNPVRLSLSIDVFEPADDLRVSLFTVLGEHQGDVRRLVLQPGERLDRDFILRFRLGGDRMRTSLSLHPDAGSRVEGTFALTIVPPVSTNEQSDIEHPRDVVLLLDRSGSMNGWKMVAARRALARMIDTLNDSDRFAVFAFDNQIETPALGRSKDILSFATDRNRFSAVEFLATVNSRGGTEIAKPLDLAVTLLDGSGDVDSRARDRILVLVTDGQVGNEDQVLQLLGARLKTIRVFTLGIDQAVNEGFLRRLAELGQGGGSCELVESEDRLDAVMEAIHRRIGVPVVTDVRLEPSPSSGIEFLADALVPDRPPSLFAGSPLLLMGRYRGHAQGVVELLGQTPAGEPWREVVVPSVRENPAIAAAWARGQVRQLEDRYAAGLGDPAALERSIIATSLRFGVLCRFTAYVAIDRAAVVNEGGKVHQITQPVESPAGWGEDVLTELACYRAPELASNDFMCEASAQPYLRHPSLVPRREVDGPAVFARPAARGLKALAKSVFAVPLSPPAPSTPEQWIGRAGYELLEKLGEDAHGTFYKGRDRRKRLVVVRILKTPVTIDGPSAIERALRKLKHPVITRILKLIQASPTGPVIAVVSEYLGAPTLAERLGRPDLFDPLAAARLVLAMADALEYAGRQLIIHGNLTPDHVLIGDDGRPRITGFGLASLDCGPDISCATVRVYVAPELVRSPGARPTARTDVYSLGVIFYRLLTGVLLDGDVGAGRPQSPRVVNPAVPTELEAICLRALAADCDSRYATAAELAADLRKFLGIKKRGLLGRIAGWSKANTEPRTTKEEPQREGFWK